ncbi:PREDICTED: uncharacterized protein LOC107065272 [Polistes dominula]|uniref:Uncharacterized protein LOC107065272 n=1 Tax=Polistes dominula TaxID=743375 RepID=A0ABM1I248_POLDO|nr:PREDICTED: uncharacterized protein LOC107065272 [Polistes dominula]XP_015174286.1 PREDICTED: uncharacterized protein LOC107065272 [Polistes dominula]
MDVTIAKREARKRRILENSERRLQKITGKNEPNEIEDLSSELNPSNVCSNTLDLEINGISVNKKPFGDKNDTLYFRGDIAVKIKDNNKTETYCGLNDILNNFYNCNDETNDKLDCTNNKSNLNHLDFCNESTECMQEKNAEINYQMQINVSNKSILSYNLLSNRISYIVLAVITNILLFFKMDHLFGKYILIPYIIMMLGRLYILTNIQEPQHGSSLIATLILCNIKPVLTYRIAKALRILTLIITDLALYLFSFILIYCGITYFLNYLDNLFVSIM